MAIEKAFASPAPINIQAAEPFRRLSDRGGVRDFFARLIRARLAGVGLFIIVFFAVLALLAPLIAPYSPTKQKVTNALQPPSAEHWLGTDELGRDMLSRIIYGSQVSLQVGLIAVGIALLSGVTLGLVAGYWSNTLAEQVIMRAMDALLAFPALVLALALVAALGPSLQNAIIAVGIVGIPAYARLTRGQVLSVKEREYVEAARTIGAPSLRIILRHILPNVTAPLIVQSSLGIGFAILAEAGLSFLGLGVQPPTPSWGSMLNSGRGYLEIDPWLIIGPGTAIFLAVLGFNFLGDGIRDVLDPRMRNA
ncbi:MAG: ABC transporter permease [Chloroflexi bacterium]|nr:ABC transporter permease [Chloroflexota bacterium]MBI3733252.1 ABC transporter permease [Chloroflexota bacterium]